MTARIPRIAPKRRRRPDPRRAPKHLAFIRQLSCVGCHRAAPSQAAHVRIGTDGGAGLKPSDRHTVPLCLWCHSSQHRGERSFWAAQRIDPIEVTNLLWEASGDVEAGERLVTLMRFNANTKG